MPRTKALTFLVQDRGDYLLERVLFSLKNLVGIICKYRYKPLDLQYLAIQKRTFQRHLFMFNFLNNINV